MKYEDDLPPACPPPDAVDDSHTVLYRFVPKAAPGAPEFYSHARLQKQNRTNSNPCVFASCSLVGDYEKSLADIPALRQFHSHIAVLDIPKGVGMSKKKIKKSNLHVDFWCFAGNCLADHVVNVFPIPEEDGNG